MLTKQHIAATTLAMLSKGYEMEDIIKAIPYVVLPDAIRMFVGQRQPSHFERYPSYSGCSSMVSWMRFLEGEKLKKLSKENLTDSVSWYLVKGIPTAVIGEETDLETFDLYNSDLTNYHGIRAHLVQDRILDAALRDKMIDVSDRFYDKFTVRHSGKVINGRELRAQIALFEEFGFIKLIGLVYKCTGILLTKEWFDNYVQKALHDAYPADMAINTYRYMNISDEVNQRIKAHNFELTDDEKSSVFIVEDLDALLNSMYEEVYTATSQEF